MNTTKGAYKQRIIKEYIKEPFEIFINNPTLKNSLKLTAVWSFLTQFDFGNDNEKLESLRKELVTYGIGTHQQSKKHQCKSIAQKLRPFVESVKNKELKNS